MEGLYLPITDDYGIIGFSYKCPKCHHENNFSDSDDGCEKCDFEEDYVDPDEWYNLQMSKPINEIDWNIKK